MFFFPFTLTSEFELMSFAHDLCVVDFSFSLFFWYEEFWFGFGEVWCHAGMIFTYICERIWKTLSSSIYSLFVFYGSWMDCREDTCGIPHM